MVSFLNLLGVVIFSPVFTGLINAIGGLLILLGLPNQKQDRVYMVRHIEPCGPHFGLYLVVALGSAHGHREPAGGINLPCLICGDAPRVEVPPSERP